MDPSRQNGGTVANGGARGDVTRAERFEDEKRRIIETCFSKQDEDGSILETYITHIKILEFSSHPTGPPPPQARSAKSEKPRIIIVAVRKSGRVRMHKSKENPTGSFSIGKTWNLDDLSAIESFTGPTVGPEQRQWAGDVGFVVVLGKPYYWQAQTDKEKKFFIASLVKIFGKYTGGRIPTLSGFEQRELDQVLGSTRRPPPQQPALPPAVSSSSSVSPPPAAGRPPIPTSGPSQSTLSVASSANYPPPGAPDYYYRSPSRGPAAAQNGHSSPAGSVDSGRFRDQTQLRRLAAANKSQESVATSLTARSDDGAGLLPPRSRNGMTGGAALGAFPVPDMPSPKEERPPPERRRPPMDPLRPAGKVDDGLVPAPLKSPAMRRDLVVVPPPRSNDRMSPRKDPAAQQKETLSSSSLKEKPAPPPAGPVPEPPALKKSPSSGAVSVLSTVTAPTSPLPEPPTTPGEPEQSLPEPPPAPLEEPAAAVDERPGLGLMIKSKKSEPEIQPTPPPPPPQQPEESRPGLGPMIKKKSRTDIAGAFWKAATAANAFKPRPGGAGDRLRQAQQNKSSDEGPDGITGVVPAPPKPVEKPPPVVEEKPPVEKPKPAPPGEVRRIAIPEVKVTLPNSSRPSSLQPSVKELSRIPEPETKDEPRRSVVVGNDVKYLATLGVDPSILDNRSVAFTHWLDYFGWVPGHQMRSCSYEDMTIDLDRELSRAQAGGWLARFQGEEDEGVEAIKRGIDVAVAECDEMDNLLTLYSVELSTLSDDIAYIEAQGQGLQVQAANQKLLKRELESLLDTCAITDTTLEPLRTAPLETVPGLESIEDALVTLYKAMIKIDPTLGSGGDARKTSEDAGDPALDFSSDYGKMRIVQEKKEMYVAESSAFMRRLVGFMGGQIEDAFKATKSALDGALSKKVDPQSHDVGRGMLWKYGPLVLYAREVDLTNWDRMIQVYQDRSHPLYKNEFRDILLAWKRNARKPAGDEAALLFTFQQEKQQENTLTAARKLTVKRSQTLAKSLRSPLGDGGSSGGSSSSSSRTNLDKTNADSLSLPYEAFAGVLDDLLPLVEMEQNFMIDFFHATTMEGADFPDTVAALGPRDRRGGDLKRHRLMEPDRELARRVTRAMEVIFASLEQDLQNLVGWVLSHDPLQGVGVLASLERKMADMSQSNQDFLNTVLQKLHGNLEGRFKRFVDEQIRAIEETKVKIKKRKGVISFMRTFPNFSVAIETMLSGSVDPQLSVRRTVDREYDRILKSMFDSLKVIARENPSVGVATVGVADPEDKEALNFHILLIENMNHYLEEVENPRGIEVLDEWGAAAASELDEHMGLYLHAVMRRPLGKLLEHLENIEAQLSSGKPVSAVAAQPSNSKAVFNKVLGGYDSREVRKGIETLRKRIEKHFGDADDPALSRGLLSRVLQECEKYYGEVELRISAVTTNVYGGDVLFEWPRADVKAAFR